MKIRNVFSNRVVLFSVAVVITSKSKFLECSSSI